MCSRLAIVCWILTQAVMLVSTARSELQPDEIAILAVADDRESEAIARVLRPETGYSSRKPDEIPMPARGDSATEKWQGSVRPAIREWLNQNDPEQKIRCLVTTWNVPLRIGRADADPAFVQLHPFPPNWSVTIARDG